MKINVAIDGPSAAGKSTIARILANELGYAHLDTGAMYRCVAYAAKCRNIAQSDELALANMMDTLDIHFDEVGRIYIGDEDVSQAIRANDMSMGASNVSAHPMVRERLVAMQKEIASAKGYILDGRDIGTVVLPNAELKIYMIASVEARTKRRYKEYIEKGIVVEYDEIFKDIEQRDYQDSHRKTSPLKKADDAIEIDTSEMSIDEVVSCIKTVLESKLK